MPPRSPAIRLPTEAGSRDRDRWFESISFQRGVDREPDFRRRIPIDDCRPRAVPWASKSQGRADAEWEFRGEQVGRPRQLELDNRQSEERMTLEEAGVTATDNRWRDGAGNCGRGAKRGR